MQHNARTLGTPREGFESVFSPMRIEIELSGEVLDQLEKVAALAKVTPSEVIGIVLAAAPQSAKPPKLRLVRRRRNLPI